MRIDIQGHVSHLDLPASKPLLPVFEAIINSFDAIEQHRGASSKIVIRTQREPAALNVANDMRIAPIVAFIIEDNGAGFTEENFLSFNTASSRHKVNGKGTGRFLWLKAFSDITIESIYKENGEWRRRTFRFDESVIDGIHEHRLEVLENDGRHQFVTKVSLSGYKSIYKSKCPKGRDSIAHSIIEHCVTRLFDKNCPQITLSDENGDISLNEIFSSSYMSHAKTDTAHFRDCTIEITTLRLTTREAKSTYAPTIDQ
jgi:hypothetical protein